MANYKSMYYKLFIEMTDTIERFKSKLVETEEIYISSEEVSLMLCKEESEQKEELNV